MNPSIWIAARLRLNDTGSGANTTGVVIASIGVAVAVAVIDRKSTRLNSSHS